MPDRLFRPNGSFCGRGILSTALAENLKDVDLDNKPQSVRDRDAAAVIPLLDSKDKFLREAAVGLLRSSNSRIAVRPLLRELADEDPETRYLAVYGLCAIVRGKQDAPLIDLFRQNEDYYLDFWRRWGQR
jgi:HEAT repeat protein